MSGQKEWKKSDLENFLICPKCKVMVGVSECPNGCPLCKTFYVMPEDVEAPPEEEEETPEEREARKLKMKAVLAKNPYQDDEDDYTGGFDHSHVNPSSNPIIPDAMMRALEREKEDEDEERDRPKRTKVRNKSGFKFPKEKKKVVERKKVTRTRQVEKKKKTAKEKRDEEQDARAKAVAKAKKKREEEQRTAKEKREEEQKDRAKAFAKAKAAAPPKKQKKPDKNEEWFTRSQSSEGEIKGRVFYFPNGGGNHGAVKHLGQYLHGNIEMCTVLLPGRIGKMERPVFRKWSELYDNVYPALAKLITGDDLPYVLVGHSFGALVSYLLMVKLRANKVRLPVHFFPLSKRSPSCHTGPESPKLFLDMTHEELKSQFIEKYSAGVPKEMLEDEEMLQSILRPFQSDLGMNQIFVWKDFKDKKPFGIPFTAFWGESDTVIEIDDVEEWEELCTDEFDLRIVEGNHFIVEEEQQAHLIMEAVQEVFDEIL